MGGAVRGDVTVFGLSHPRVNVAAHILSRFGMERVDVLNTHVYGHYLDEIVPAGKRRWSRVRGGEVGRVEVESADDLSTPGTPVDLPMPRGPQEAMQQTCDLLDGCLMSSRLVPPDVQCSPRSVLRWH